MSFTETLVILIVAVIVFGPKRLPEMARKLGRWSGMLRRAKDEFMRQLSTMDQTVGDTLNSATGELDNLLPTDEELGQATDFSVGPPIPEGYPEGGDYPSDAWYTEPPAEEAKPETPAEPPAPAPKPEPPPARPRRAAAPAPRSLGLSPTRKEARRG